MLYLIATAAALAAIAGRRPATHLARLALADRAARRHFAAMVWASVRWRHLSRNAGLAYLDHHHRRRLVPRVPGTTAVRVHPVATPKLRWPAARFRVTSYGWTAEARTVPKIGREEFAKAAPWIADAWGCHRVQVTKSRPGRVQVRAMRRDPLAEPYPMAAAPAGVYGTTSAPRTLYLGRDSWGDHRSVPLANLPAILVGGLPGYGKTSLVASWLCQLAPAACVRLGLVADGKGGGDYADFEALCPVIGDDLDQAAEHLARMHDRMRGRLADMPTATGHRNGWHAGLSARWPLLVTVADECHTFLDLEAVKGDRQAEAAVRECRHALSQLVRKGRSVLMLTIIMTQKTTGDAIPTAIRDCMPLALSFATKTRDSAVACLGEAIRDYPDQCPTLLQGPEYVGVLTAAMRTGLDPFTMLRVPEVTEAAVSEMARGLLPATAARPTLAAVPALPAAGVPA
jgi:S-DNA-T family DNA segregation ATPase FtsK/SpoIIIE